MLEPLRDGCPVQVNHQLLAGLRVAHVDDGEAAEALGKRDDSGDAPRLGQERDQLVNGPAGGSARPQTVDGVARAAVCVCCAAAAGRGLQDNSLGCV